MTPNKKDLNGISNTPEAKIARIFSEQQDYFLSNATRSVDFRLKQLKKLKRVVKENEEEILKALALDFGKSRFEAYASELGIFYEEVNIALKNLKEWTQKQKVNTPLSLWPSKSYYVHEPKGVTLIIGPWNYPFQLLLTPLVASIAAGNTAIIKPPEQTVATSLLVEKLLSINFDAQFLAVVQGAGSEVVPYMMKNHRFDHVFFTGSTGVGRKIAEMAAQQLVPTTLELGGKSPAIVDASAKLKVAAKRIAFGKWLNAGQTCVAPDYVLVEHSRMEAFLEALKNVLDEFYPKGALASPDYTQMIHQQRFDTVISYLKSGEIYYGGKSDIKNLKIEPTIVTEVSLSDPIMNDEIFGPVLPVIPYKNPAEAIDIVRKRSKPLALYIFTKDKAMEKTFLEKLQFGGGAVNNTVVHLSNPKLPFGGIGHSGYGNYHGKFGFETFSHKKSILKTATWFDLRAKYPPYSTLAYRIVQKVMG